MIERWFWRWRYQRLPNNANDPSTWLLTLLTRYCRLTRKIRYTETDYRTRNRYTLSTKTDNMGELLALSNQICELIKIQSPHVDRLQTRYVPRVSRRFDIYITDETGVPYDEHEIVEQLLKRLEDIEQALGHIKQNKDDLYVYYNQSLQYFVFDILEVLDTFISMQIGVSNGRRHAPGIIAGRQGSK